MSYQQIKLKDIHNYLKKSLKYQLFIDNNIGLNEEILVPLNFKNDLKIKNYSDFVLLLETCSFFMLCDMPKEVNIFINQNKKMLQNKINELEEQFYDLETVIEKIRF